MLPGLDHLVDRWRAGPRPAATLALCQAIADFGEERRRTAHKNIEEWQAFLDLCAEVAAVASATFAEDVDILLSIARMHLAAGSLHDAQETLIQVLKRAKSDPMAFRLLGEALLRRGDAHRSLKATGKALQLGMKDPKTQIWLDRARFYAGMQDARGMEAVADEVRRVLGYAASLPVAASSTRWTLPPGTLSDAPTAPVSVPAPTSRSPKRPPPPPPSRGPHVRTLMGIPAVTEASLRAAIAKPGAAKALVDEETATEAPTVQGFYGADDDVPTRRRDLSEFQDRLGVPLAPPRPALAIDVDTADGPTMQRRSPIPAPRDAEDDAPTQVSHDEGPDSLIKLLAVAATRAADEYEPETKVHQKAVIAPPPPDDPDTNPGIAPLAHLRSALLADTARLPSFDPAPPAPSPATPAPPTPSLLFPPTPPPSADPTTARRLVGLTEDSVASERPPRAHELPVTRIEPPMARMRAIAEPDPPKNRIEPSASPPRYEPPASLPRPELASVAPPAPIRRRAPGRGRVAFVAVVVVLLLGAGGAALAWQKRERDRHALEADRLAVEAEGLVAEGGATSLARAADLLGRARAVAAVRAPVATAAVHLATVQILDFGGDEKRAVEAVDEARRLGARGPGLAALSLAAATALSNRSLSERLLADYDGVEDNLGDAYYQLAAGAALELSGDASARARYEKAVELAPALQSARYRLAMSWILEGEVDKGRAAAGLLPDARAAERDLLVAIAAAGTDATSLGADGKAELPKTLGFVALSLEEGADAKAEVLAAVATQRSPLVLAWIGRRALGAADMDLAKAAADGALAIAPHQRSARLLAAQIAVHAGRMKDAGAHLAGDESVEALELSGIVAYEEGDRATLDAVVGKLADRAPASFRVALARLQGKRPIADKVLEGIVAADPWADVVTLDALLDRSERKRVKAKLAGIASASTNPSLRLRAARLARETKDLGAARAALGEDASNRLAVRESILIAGAEDKITDELVAAAGGVSGPEGPWLRAYALAAKGDADAARKVVKGLEIAADADLEVRVTAALALAEIGDVKRGRTVIGPLLESFPRRYDAIRAGIGLGLLPPGSLP